MKVVLTEKPSVARDIALHLGAKDRHEGYFEGNGYQVTWAYGHLVCLKDPEDYDPQLKRWSLNTLPFIPQQFELKIVATKIAQKQFSTIKKLFKGASELICATDAGREGELIFRYILTLTNTSHRHWKRLWLSSLTDEAMLMGFNNLRSGSDYDHLYAAARCRSEADWIVGLNATRNFTVRFGAKGLLWSVGRVQTPVLALIVRRDDEIRNFKPEPFWELLTKYRGATFKLKGDRFKAPNAATEVLNQIKDHPFTIEKVITKKENELPPLLYDLTELQRDMNRRFGLSAADTLKIAQDLYEQKLITYPRTDSRYLTSDMKSLCAKSLQNLKKFKAKEIEVLNLAELNFSSRIINDSKVTDHHAIIPTGKISSQLSHMALAVYDAIVMRLIAIFYPPCLKEHTTVEGSSNNHPFQATGVVILVPGWSALYPKKVDTNKKENTPQEIQALPLFQKGESGTHAPYITEGVTKPPPHYTENTLLGAMETAGKLVEDEALREALKAKGIGTPATRASIIETLLTRTYINRTGKTLTATPHGRFLIALIQDRNLKSPELTGEWEAKLKEIEQGKYNASDFMQHIATFIRRVVANSDLANIDYANYGPCPKCKNPVIKGKKGYGCSTWSQGCDFVLWKEYKDSSLTEVQIRSLIQKRILTQPIQGAVLTLTDQGLLQELTLPQPAAATGRTSTKPRAYAKSKSNKAK